MSNKLGTMYAEGERTLTNKNLSIYGINPIATQILVHSYKLNVAPHTAFINYQVSIKEKMELVTISLSTPGFQGKSNPAVGALDKFGLKLFARSYYENLRPMPISFLYDGVEIHIRDPSENEGDKKNVARHIFNPTK